MIEIDSTSLLVTTDTDVTIAHLEGRLNKEGYTLNYQGVPNNDFLLADVLNDRIPNLYGEAFGGIEDLCLQVRLAQPDGTLWVNLPSPRSAAGPSLKKLTIGSQEMLGIPVQAILRLFYLPHQIQVACVVFPGHRQQEFFLQVLRKNRISLPLLEALPRSLATRFLEQLPEKHEVIALALWGEEAEVEGKVAFLQDLAHLKKGAWFEVDQIKVKNQFLEQLRRQAIASWKEKTELEQAPVSPSHLKLMKRLGKIS